MEFCPRGELQGLRRNSDHRLADASCWNIGLLADLAEVITFIAWTKC